MTPTSTLAQITPEDLRDYHERLVTASEIALKYRTSAKQVRETLPKRKPWKAPSALANLTPSELESYHLRRTTPAEIAKKCGLTAKYVRETLPKRAPVRTEKMRSELVKARKAYKMHLAAKVVAKELTAEQAANMSHCSKRSMHRYAKEVRCSKT